MLVVGTVAFTAGPAFGQVAQPPPKHAPHAKRHVTASGERPVDVGPYTPAANGAYQGGGVILQGAPGAPPPAPEPTPPGQTPRDAVPH